MAGIFPCPTFKDKSTYIESSTKVYDDVSVPHSPRKRPSSYTAEERGLSRQPASC